MALAKPGTPAKPTVLFNGGGVITIALLKAKDTDAVEFFDVLWNGKTFTVAGTEKTFTQRWLTVGNYYDFAVIARNSAGPSASSAVLNVRAELTDAGTPIVADKPVVVTPTAPIVPTPTTTPAPATRSVVLTTADGKTTSVNGVTKISIPLPSGDTFTYEVGV
ncbi:hypothetical protein [Hymenobacter sp. BT491]|uniref:hypothetical protein n=1 Tax=Hymenobacter sp. BT491 TaxID=2766779 RepID=UPI001653DE98|nr:hypothetical protein [Hymenobacter sp. BT491]MBC6988921.1 hypothetical protein [Hymenobacter sp. BT491]